MDTEILIHLLTGNSWSMVKMGKVHVEFTQLEVKSARSKCIRRRSKCIRRRSKCIRRQRMHRLSYQMEVDLFSKRGDLQFRAILNGKTKGNSTIQFETSYDMMEE